MARKPELNGTSRILLWRAKNKLFPVLTEDSFVHGFGSEAFFEDGECDCQFGIVGFIDEDVKKKDRLVVLHNPDGTSFAPSVKVPVVTGIIG